MAVMLRRDANIFLIGSVSTQILGSKLPSNRQVLSVLFYNIRCVKLNVRESANLTVRECIIFWEKTRIPTRAVQHCVSKLINLYDKWRSLQKNSKKIKRIYRQKEKKFTKDLDNLFDIAHSNALNMIKIEEDKQFLINQRQHGRIGWIY